MSVLLETSLGDLVIDLLIDEAPKACQNFLKLCKIKYYNYAPVYNLQKGFAFQTGDPLGPDSKESNGGSSVWGLLRGGEDAGFEPEFSKRLGHMETGTVSMATTSGEKNPDQRYAASQFLITLADDVEQLNGKAAVFGKVVEGYDVLSKINDAFTDSKGRPLRDIRIRHTVVLDDPFPDPEGLEEPPSSPLPTPAQLATVRIADDEELEAELNEEAMEELRREREAKAQALTLEMVGDLPFAEVKPPENVLFVCKLNPVTQDSDLELIFSRFGKILSCEVIRDKKSGDSLQYAFVEFENKGDCEQAYFKMDGVLIDDHRIHVDFSQSVSRLSDTWRSATNIKRKKQANFGGITGLEKRRQYRDVRDQDENEYNMVFEKNESRKSQYDRQQGRRQTRDPIHERLSERSRSPPHRYKDQDPRREYQRRSHDHRGNGASRHGDGIGRRHENYRRYDHQ